MPAASIDFSGLTHINNFVAARNYDGVDIDWEPLPFADARQYTNLITSFRAALQNQFDQISLMPMI